MKITKLLLTALTMLGLTSCDEIQPKKPVEVELGMTNYMAYYNIEPQNNPDFTVVGAREGYVDPDCDEPNKSTSCSWLYKIKNLSVLITPLYSQDCYEEIQTPHLKFSYRNSYSGKYDPDLSLNYVDEDFSAKTGGRFYFTAYVPYKYTNTAIWYDEKLVSISGKIIFTGK